MIVNDLLQAQHIKDGLRLVAGKKGINKVIRWIYFADCTQCLSDDFNVVDFVRGEELVIITNKSLTDSDDKILEMLKDLAAKQISGLVVSEGQISQKVIRYCNQEDLPLLELSYSLHLIDLSQFVCREIVEEEMDTNTKERILSSLLFGENQDYSSIISQASSLGINLSKKHKIVVLRIYYDDSIKERGITQVWEGFQTMIESSFGNVGIRNLLLLTQSNRIILMLQEEDCEKKRLERILSNIIQNMEKSYPIVVKAGIGATYEYVEDFRKSYKEANCVLEILKVEKLKKNIFYYDSLGIYSLLAQVTNTRFLDDYVNKYLGKLMESDRIQDGTLCETLQKYLDCGGNANAAAEELYIHRNTMHYRMDKIKKILGMELNDLDELLELKLAFAIIRYRDKE